MTANNAIEHYFKKSELFLYDRIHETERVFTLLHMSDWFLIENAKWHQHGESCQGYNVAIDKSWIKLQI